jgi:hypothetical protein
MDATYILLASSMVAGFLGVIMGVGGGLVLIPIMVGFLGIPVHLAVAASLVAITANSISGASIFLRSGLANVRLGILMSLGALVATLLGVILGKLAGGQVVTATFSALLVFTFWFMFNGRKDAWTPPNASDALALRLGLDGSYLDANTGRDMPYGVRHVRRSLMVMTLAGLSAGMLGVGGGLVQVPVMDRILHLPIKVSTATSNFMMGLSSAAGATAYLILGDVHPLVTGPVVVGIVVGSRVGSAVAPRLRSRHIRWLFLALLVAMLVQMLWKTVTG